MVVEDMDLRIVAVTAALDAPQSFRHGQMILASLSGERVNRIPPLYLQLPEISPRPEV
jgi:hypothetical protein